MKPRTSLLLRVCVIFMLSSHHCVNSANILFFFGVSTYSHRIIAWPLVEALAERNHTVTFFQPDINKNPHPNVTEVNPKLAGISEQMSFMPDRLSLGARRLLLKITYQLPKISLSLCDAFLQDQEIIDWINRSKFDLIFIDGLFNECGYGIAYKMNKAKTAIFSTSHPFGWHPDALGYPSETSWIPEMHFSFDLPLNFVNRVWATLSILYWNTIRHAVFPEMETLLRTKLDIPDMPSIPAMMANTSLVLTNTHFSEELPRSLPPNVVSVGGMNCIEKSSLKTIPKDMEDFINKGGEDGFILLSFGSGAKISDATPEIQEIFFKVLERIKIPVIWKWEVERPKGMPSNVLASKWTPQQELLSHPKIRAFLTHGGLLSMHESICHQVPMIAFPVFAEQDFNAERLHRTGRGIRVEISTLTEEELETAIRKILTDDSFKKNVMEVSQRFFDRPQKPVETAVWWTEYILRHDVTTYMRPLAVDLTWYQRRLLDVWGFLFAVLIALSLGTVKLTKALWRILANSDNTKVSSSPKSKKVKRN